MNEDGPQVIETCALEVIFARVMNVERRAPYACGSTYFLDADAFVILCVDQNSERVPQAQARSRGTAACVRTLTELSASRPVAPETGHSVSFVH